MNRAVYQSAFVPMHWYAAAASAAASAAAAATSAATTAAIATASTGLVLHLQVKQLQRKLAHDSVWVRGLLGLLPITAAAALVVLEHTQCVVGERPGHRQPAELVELGDEPAATHLHHRECGEQHGVD